MRAHLYRFLAALVFLGLYGGSESTAEEWGTSHTECKQFMDSICSHSYKNMKSALKLQTDGEEEGVFDSSNFPLLMKIGFWLDMARLQCHPIYFPGEGLALDEMMVLATMPNPFYTFMPFKPSVRKGIKDSP